MTGSTNPRGNIKPELLANSRFDVIIIGAGVVGCALARRFTLEGARVLVIEKGEDILGGASKGNSAILHTGFDSPPGSLEQRCIAAGYAEFIEIHKSAGLPILPTGALVVAWSSAEEEKLDAILTQAQTNGVLDGHLLSATQLASREPNLSGSAIAALQIPREYVIDPWTTPFVYLMQAIENGARVMRSTEVTGGVFDGDQWHIETSQGSIQGKVAINSAGLYGDRVDELLVQKSGFTIRPRKGQFLVFDKTANHLVNSIILPVPSETTKGVVVCKTIYGNLLVGPTAEEQQSRDDASVDTETLEFLHQRGVDIIPALSNHPVTATYAGIRPATEFKDYCIGAYAGKNYLSVGGIRSTGLSSALGIAQHVYQLYQNLGNQHQPLNGDIWPSINPIAEHVERDWCQAGNGGIVCHCELVTRREIQQALRGPLAATSLSALKRRTRVTMGRCQGFYCSAELSEITAGQFSRPIGIGDV